MINQGVTDSFRQGLLLGQQDLSNDRMYVALFTDQANIGEQTTVYTNVGECSGQGYTQGGQLITGATVKAAPGNAWVEWPDVSWTGLASTFRASGALIYNFDRNNASILVLNFGTPQAPVAGVFTLKSPPNPAQNALIRIG